LNGWCLGIIIAINAIEECLKLSIDYLRGYIKIVTTYNKLVEMQNIVLKQIRDGFLVPYLVGGSVLYWIPGDEKIGTQLTITELEEIFIDVRRKFQMEYN